MIHLENFPISTPSSDCDGSQSSDKPTRDLAGPAFKPSLINPEHHPFNVNLSEQFSSLEERGYTLGDRLGKGGFGVVFEAERVVNPPDTISSVGDSEEPQPYVRRVAIKVLYPKFVVEKRDDIIERFRREYLVQGSLTPLTRFLEPILDVGKITYAGVETIGIVMPLEEDGSLANQQEVDEVERKFDADQLFDISDMLCAGLNEMHSRGMVHRDIKPANIFVDLEHGGKNIREQQITGLRIGDFGLAKLIGGEDGNGVELASKTMPPDVVDSIRGSVTDVGSVTGTPYYASPEQMRKFSSCPGDDMYSLGSLLYELRTGVFPGRVFHYNNIDETKSEEYRRIVDEERPDVQEGLHSVGRDTSDEPFDCVINTLIKRNIKDRLFVKSGVYVYPLLIPKDVPMEFKKSIGEHYDTLLEKYKDQIPKEIFMAIESGSTSATLVRLSLAHIRKRYEQNMGI